MNWDDLKVFLAIVRTGSVRAGASFLGVSHSTVLRRLDAFEDAIGLSLFSRSASGYELTNDGRDLLQEAEQIETSVIAFERRAHSVDQEHRGKIVVTTPESFFSNYLASRFGEFRERYPEIDVHFVFTHTLLDLGRRDADIAIRFTNEPDDNLIGRKLPHFREGYYAAPSYLEKHNLDDEQTNAVWLGWRDDMSWVKESPYPHIEVFGRMQDVTAQYAACRAGAGLAMLPCFVGEAAEDLVRLPGSKIVDGIDAWVLYHPDLKRTARVQAFTNFIVQILNEDEDIISGNI